MKQSQSTYGTLKINHNYARKLVDTLLTGRYIKDCIIYMFFEIMLIGYFDDKGHTNLLSFILLNPIGSILFIIINLIIVFIVLKFRISSESTTFTSQIKNIMKSNNCRSITNNLKEEQYQDIVNEMAIAVNIPTPQAFIIDSSNCNILCTGNLHKEHKQWVGNSYIAITTTMLNTLNRNQLQCVISDELVRIASRDTFTDILISHMLIKIHQDYENMKTNFLFNYWHYDTDSTGTPVTYGKDGNKRHFLIGWLIYPLGYLIHLPLLLLACHLAKKYAQNRDYNADTGSLQIIDDPNNLIKVLRICDANGAIESPNIFSDNLFFMSNQIFSSIDELMRYSGKNPHTPTMSVNNIIVNALNSHTTPKQRIKYIESFSHQSNNNSSNNTSSTIPPTTNISTTNISSHSSSQPQNFLP